MLCLVGFLISLFTDFSIKTGLTPIALAFVMGYSVDVFFTFIDSVVTRLKTPVATPGKAGRGLAGQFSEPLLHIARYEEPAIEGQPP